MRRVWSIKDEKLRRIKDNLILLSQFIGVERHTFFILGLHLGFTLAQLEHHLFRYKKRPFNRCIVKLLEDVLERSQFKFPAILQMAFKAMHIQERFQDYLLAKKTLGALFKGFVIPRGMPPGFQQGDEMDKEMWLFLMDIAWRYRSVNDICETLLGAFQVDRRSFQDKLLNPTGSKVIELFYVLVSGRKRSSSDDSVFCQQLMDILTDLEID